MRRLNNDRNARMVERLMPRIEEGGALSQWAPCIWPVRPVIQQLSKRGCRLTPVD